jgi:hypothetical protein
MDSVVRYATESTTSAHPSFNGTLTTEHTVLPIGLSPGPQYFSSPGSGAASLTAKLPDFFSEMSCADPWWVRYNARLDFCAVPGRGDG